jgi:hypothetical protein
MNRRQRLRYWARPYWRALKTWLINYGFAGLVFLAFVGGVIIAQQTEVPATADLPGLAFGSQSLYRNEVGGISFVFYYLAALVFVLALNGRGFTIIGPKGIRDGKVVNRETQETIRGQERSIAALERDLTGNIEAARQLRLQAKDQDEEIAQLRELLAEQQQRIDSLEKRS